MLPDEPAASPAPNSSAPSPPEAPPPAAVDNEDADRKPILIGSQRPGHAPPPPREDTKPALPPREVRPPRPPRPEQQPAAPRADAVKAEAGEADAPRKPDLDRPAPRSAPVPISKMTADLDAEVDAALGGASLDSLMSQRVAPESEGQLEPESKHNAVVMQLHRDDVFLQLPGRNQAVVSVRTFAQPPAEGDRLEVIIRKFNAEDGLYEVNVPGSSVKVQNWGDISEGAVVEAKVTATNTGGLECTVNNIRGFIPASQVALYRTENLGDYANQKLLCVVMESNPERGQLVLSHRAVLEREKQESKTKLMETLEVGQTKDGIVRKLQPFGAFVDIGGLDGLVHVSQLSWDRVNHPSEVLTEGQKIQVKIEKIDRDTGKIGLSYRNTLVSPWSTAAQKYPNNAIVKGTVSRLMEFGAFVKIEPGVEGLVHVSELAYHRVTRVNSVVEVGQEVDVKVLSVDTENQRMSLSLKQARAMAPVEKEPSAEEEEAAAEPRKPLIPSSGKPLKGGTSRKSGGDKFGLNW